MSRAGDLLCLDGIGSVMDPPAPSHDHIFVAAMFTSRLGGKHDIVLLTLPG